MTPAIALAIIAGVLLVSGFKNKSVVDTALGRDTKKKTGNVPDASDVTGNGGNPFNAIADAVRGATSDGNYGMLRQEMERMAALNTPYKWGGGHLGYGDADGPWDCSGAVSRALHVAGYLSGPPLVSGGFMLWGKRGRGHDFTVYANPTHVFIRDEHTGQDWGTTKTAGRGGPAWHRHTTKNFTARHGGPAKGSLNDNIQTGPLGTPGAKPNIGR